MKADIFIDASLVEIEKMLSTSQYDLIYPTIVIANLFSSTKKNWIKNKH